MQKRFYILLAALVLVSMALAACALASSEPSATATATPTIQVVPTVISTGTSQPANKWALPVPPAANQLPTQLSPAIAYVQPPENCAKKNDPNTTCSTIKGQKTDGDFVLKSDTTLVMTGDEIEISQNGKSLVERPSYDTVHDLWVVVNATPSDMTLHMYAPDGSFRGYFTATDWNVQKVAHLRDLHLYLFLLPTQTYDRFTPTPVPNCESRYGCSEVDVRVIVFDGNGMHVAGYGLYKENQPFWQDLLQSLGQ